MIKGDIFKIRDKERFFMFVGYFGADLVLAPMNEDEDQVLIYSRSEMNDFISTKYFIKLHPANKK
ncbi:MAG: hypothetical protein WAO56_01950 [Miniphocaeibacter sp.]|uniref:hypothetical protein n=1 Tax=Miniphocaeibacter sp. TaxID=3100973 RepID=UPI003BAFC0B3